MDFSTGEAAACRGRGPGLAPVAVDEAALPRALVRVRGTGVRGGGVTPGAAAGPDPGTESPGHQVTNEPRQRVWQLPIVGIIVCVSTL